MLSIVRISLFAAALTASSTGAWAKENGTKVLEKISVEPKQALGLLEKGNERFINGTLRQDGESKADVERLAKGQTPHSILVSCSDSRVPPELVFDQKLGELFTVRTAGEVLSPSSIGSIEYAIEHLGSRLIVVLGHTNCGAVKAAVETLGGPSTGSPNLDQVVADIHPRIKPLMSAHSVASKDFVEEGWANASGVAQDLVQRSKLIAAAVKSGKVQVQVGLYDLATGKVNFKKQ